MLDIRIRCDDGTPHSDGEPWLSFDDGYYWFLYPSIESLLLETGRSIDLYGDAEFAGSDLDALRRMLSRARTLVEMQPGSWEVVTGTQTEPVRRDILATVHRAAFLELLDTWDRLVTRAQETGRSIVCLGD